MAEPNVAVDEKTGRKYFLEQPDDLKPGEPVVFLLNLHGGGSHGTWQRLYFPAFLYKEKYRLVIASPSAATKEPARRWVGEADDVHLRNIVEHVLAKYNVRSFWLVGHSQGGMTSNRLLTDKFYIDRVDGWLSLSGGRIGPIEWPPEFFVPVRATLPADANQPAPANTPRPGRAAMLEGDHHFIFAVGEHEMVALPETSPWAEKYGAAARVRQPDVIDTEPGLIFDTMRDGRSNKSWGLKPRPGTSQMWIYPNARDGKVIADVVRIDKGHTEGLEPKITELLVRMIAEAPAGKVAAAA